MRLHSKAGDRFGRLAGRWGRLNTGRGNARWGQCGRRPKSDLPSSARRRRHWFYLGRWCGKRCRCDWRRFGGGLSDSRNSSPRQFSRRRRLNRRFRAAAGRAGVRRRVRLTGSVGPFLRRRKLENRRDSGAFSRRIQRGRHASRWLRGRLRRRGIFSLRRPGR